MISIRITNKRIFYLFIKRRTHIAHFDYIKPKRVYLIKPFLTQTVPAVSELSSNHISCVFGTLLIIVCKIQVCPRNHFVKNLVWKKKKSGKADTHRCTEFCGTDSVFYSKLEISHQGKTQPFSSSKNVSVIIRYYGRNTYKARRIGRCLKIKFISLYFGWD